MVAMRAMRAMRAMASAQVMQHAMGIPPAAGVVEVRVMVTE